MAAEAAVSSAVLKLEDLLKQKANLLRGVAGEVRLLKDELLSLLGDAAEENRDLAHDAEDAVEVFVFKVEKARMMLGRIASSPNHLYHLNKFSRAIKSIRKRLHTVKKNRRDHQIRDPNDRPSDGVGSSEDVEPRRRLAVWQKDKHVVGMEKDVELLLQKAILEETNEGLSIAAIVGMDGIGKSTLARKMYNHAAVAGRFERRAWAVASKEVNPRDVIKEILLQTMKRTENERVVIETVEKLELPELLQQLRQRLQGKRYFIVFDDVWDDGLWEELANAFPDEGKGSRLLITSHSPVMADYTRYVHVMKGLDDEESWMLLEKIASIHNSDEDLEDIGRKIVEKCSGLPLAITLAGGLLSKQKSGLENLLEEINSNLNRSRNNVMQAILELSYQNLDPKLKSCFLCLSFFKDDVVISARKLLDVWIAEGLIPEEGEATMEETATKYLEDLIDRNMVQIKETAKDGRLKTCLMHDLVRNLSIAKAEEEIGLEILKQDCKSESSTTSRHRVLYCNQGRFNDSIYGNKQIRSLFIRGALPYLFTTSFSSYWMSFQLLRVLDFEGCKSMTRLPSAITSLIGLRYLSLRDTDISDLPSSLPGLKNLLVLDLRGLLPVEMSDLLGKMISLRHLYASAFYFEKPPEITALKYLQTLNYVNFTESDMSQVTYMTRIRKLGINLFRVSSGARLFYLLGMLEELVHLKLNYCKDLNLDRLGDMWRITRLKLHGEIPSLPRDFPPNLVHLSLVWSHLKEDPMSALQKLPKLLYLKLSDAYEGEEMVVSDGGFPVLKALSLDYLWKLRNIRVEEGGMPELRRLEISDCRALESLPGEEGGMGELEELKIAASTGVAAKVRGGDCRIISDRTYVQIIDDHRFD